MISFEKLIEMMQKEYPGRVKVASYADFKFQHDCGIALDFDLYGGSLVFQHFIRDHGTDEEKQRLRDMKVGYPW